MPTQQQEFNTALSGLTPTQRATYTAANPTIGVGGVQQNYNAGTAAYSPVSSLSSGSGATTIDNAVTDHNKDMLGLAGAPKTTTTTPASTTSVNDTIKAQGGLSVDEVNASGMDVTNYNYDPKTKYFIPKVADQTPSALAYENDKKTINDAFASHVSAMDAATSSLISSIQGIYSSRIAAQADANKRELATYDTMNTRFGTSRYAPGVAQGVLTADERVGLDRISKIAAEEAGLIAQANQSLVDKKYSAFVQQRNELNALRTERIDTLKDLQTNAYKAQQDKITNDLNAKIHSDTVSYQDKQLAIQQATLSETVRKDKVAELQKAAELKVKTDAANLLAGSLKTPVVKVAGTVNPADQKAFLAGYTPEMQTMIKGVADYSIDPSAASKRVGAGISPIQLETLAKAYNPDYRAGQYAAINSFLKSWSSGGNNSVVQSANTVVQHLSELAIQAEKLGNASSGDLGPFTSKYNSARQWLKEGNSDPNVYEFKQTAMLVATEMAKIMKNGSGSSAAPTTEEIDHQLGIITTGLSPDTAKALIENSIGLMGDRLNTARENYINVVGTSPNSVLFPSAQNAIKELQTKGYSVDLSSLNPSPLANVSDSDLISGITSPTSASSTPSSYFNGLMDIINAPQSQ